MMNRTRTALIVVLLANSLAWEAGAQQEPDESLEPPSVGQPAPGPDKPNGPLEQEPPATDPDDPDDPERPDVEPPDSIEMPTDPKNVLCCIVGSCCPPPQPDPPQGTLGIDLDLLLPRSERLHSMVLEESAALEAISLTNLRSEVDFAHSPGLATSYGSPLAELTEEPAVLVPCDQRIVPAPIEVRRNAVFYGRSEHFSTCQQAAEEILEWRTVDGEYNFKIGDIALTSEEKEAYGQSLERYRRACFDDPHNETGAAILGDLVPRLTNSSGILFWNSRPQCGGFVTGGRLVTARHCFPRAECQDDQTPRCTLSIPEGWYFETFGSPPLRLDLEARQLEPDEADLARWTPANDWVAIRLSQASSELSNSIKVRRPQPWEALFVVGFNTHALDLARLLGQDSEQSDLDFRTVDVDLSPLCRAAIVDQRFVYHACQTDIGSSGSPLFVVDSEGTPALVGIQAGRSSTIRNRCTKPYVPHFPNYGLALPETAIAALQPGV